MSDAAVSVIPDPEGQADALLVVEVLGAPLLLWDRARVHSAELMREFALLQIGAETGTAHRQVPARLLELVDQLQRRYAGTSDAQNLELEQALAAGERTHDFRYRVPPSVGPACLELAAMLDEADAYCASGHQLMTLVAPADQQAFRTWYLGEFARQAEGLPPQPWTGPTD